MPKHDDWLLISEQELNVAKSSLRSVDVMVIPIIMLTQQSAEKALKAYLTYQKHPFPKTHALLDLLEFCTEYDRDFKCLLQHALLLNPYITRFRYPDDNFMTPSFEMAGEAVESAEIIFDFVRSRIRL